MADLREYGYEVACVPDEDVLDLSQPAAARYLRDVERINYVMRAHIATMKPQHVAMVKGVHAGGKYAHVAEKLGVSPATVAKATGTPKGVKLLNLLTALSSLQGGLPEAVRKHTLAAIIEENRIEDPRVAIAATAEYNKMCHQRELIETGQAGGGTIELIINSEKLPRTVLDG